MSLDTEVRDNCAGCGITHRHWTPEAFKQLQDLFREAADLKQPEKLEET